MIRNFLFITFLLLQLSYCLSEPVGSISSSTNLFRSAGQIRLSALHNGVDGKLILLIDNRLPDGIAAWEYLDSVGNDSALQNAVLIILSQKGDTIFTEKLEKPAAWLQLTDTIEDSPTWVAIAVDYSIGMGSYNGPVTSFLRVKDAKIEWLQATDAATNELEKISLMRSLKTEWRLIQTHPPQILKVACRPDFEKGNDMFKLIYTRYSLKKARWYKYERVENGYLDFENESDFPPASKFPK